MLLTIRPTAIHFILSLQNMACISQGLTAYIFSLGSGIISTNSLSNVGIILAWFGALPHYLIRCNVHTESIWEKVGGTNMELRFANTQLGNLSGCAVMTLLLTITLQGNSWANQLSGLTPAGPPRQPDETQSQASLTISCSTHQGGSAQHTSNIVHRPTQCFHLLNKTPTTLA